MLDSAIAATRRHLGTEPHHLCCGEAGRLIVSGGRARTRAADGSVEDAARALVDGYARAGWMLHAFRERLITPSLFSGAGGLGLALLAASGAEETSRVLLLRDVPMTAYLPPSRSWRRSTASGRGAATAATGPLTRSRRGGCRALPRRAPPGCVAARLRTAASPLPPATCSRIRIAQFRRRRNVRHDEVHLARAVLVRHQLQRRPAAPRR